jgi:hypothetical protein
VPIHPLPSLEASRRVPLSEPGGQSPGSHGEALGISNSEEKRRRYRQMLFTTKGMSHGVPAARSVGGMMSASKIP